MDDLAFVHKHRLTDTSFERTRKLPFSKLVTYFLNLNKGPYQQELDNYFSVLNPDNLPSQVVTKSALTQARKHLSHTAFLDLNHRVVDQYYGQQKTLETWKGHRLCAIDGSRIKLPDEPDIVEEFGLISGKPAKKDCPQALAPVYYDVLNYMAIDSGIYPNRTSELTCAVLHQEHTQLNDLILLDRGYNAFWLYAFYEANKQRFCMRAKSHHGKEFKAFVQGGKSQEIITLKPVDEAYKKCQEKDLSTQPLTLRLVRVELDNEVEVLVTNLLDEQLYPETEFKALYHLQWGIEENYKRLKQWVEIENFTGKSALSVKQDFHARVLSTNLTAIAVNAAQKQVDKNTRKRQFPYADETRHFRGTEQRWLWALVTNSLCYFMVHY